MNRVPDLPFLGFKPDRNILYAKCAAIDIHSINSIGRVTRIEIAID
jgi:hypothetical protein